MGENSTNLVALIRIRCFVCLLAYANFRFFGTMFLLKSKMSNSKMSTSKFKFTKRRRQ
jgi:hypothetical protein